MTESHAEVRRALRSAVRLGRLPQALLLTGEEGIGKLALAEWLVQLRWCLAPEAPCGSCPSCRKVSTGNHPDHLVVRRGVVGAAAGGASGGASRHDITVDQVRQEILPLLSVRAAEGRGRAVVLAGAEDLNVEAQNALLKVLEEPPPESLLVLVTSREDALLDTIRSRCHELRMFPDEALVGAPSDALRAGAESGAPGTVEEAGPGPVFEALDLLLQGKTTPSHFAQQLAHASGGEDLADAEQQRRVLSWMQRRARDLALLAAGGGPQRLSTPPPVDAAWLPSAEDMLSVLELLLEAAQDVQRHIPGHVLWLALGRGIRSTAVGGRGGANP